MIDKMSQPGWIDNKRRANSMVCEGHTKISFK